jgi:uncharacterized phage protein gp47/JayE
MKAIPSIQTLYTNLASDLKNKLGIIASAVLKLAIDALASVLAGMLKLCYIYLVDVQNNLFPDTADIAANGGQLERMGMIWLKRMPYPATDGYYTASVTGTAGSVIPAQVTFKSNDNTLSPGFLYILDNAYTLTGSGDVIALRALNAGEDFALNIGDGLTATQPLLGVNQGVTIASITTAPTNAEDTELYRQQILDAIILEPQGGSKADYRIWSADAAGVQRVFPQLKAGDAGTVQVYVEATPADSTDGKGTPSGTLITAVTTVINTDPDESVDTNDRARLPLQAALEVLAISPVPVDVAIAGLETDTSDIRAAISANLASFLFSVRPYIAGCDLPRDKNDILTTVKVQSVVTDTIGNTNSFLSFTLSVNGVVVNSFTFSGGNIPYLRNVTYS